MKWLTTMYVSDGFRLQMNIDMCLYRVQGRVFWFWWETLLVTDSVKEAKDMYNAIVSTGEDE